MSRVHYSQRYNMLNNTVQQYSATAFVHNNSAASTCDITAAFYRKMKYILIALLLEIFVNNSKSKINISG